MPQSLSNVIVHLVFSTKTRERSITPEIREEINPYMSGVLRNCGCTPIAVGGVEDHMHVLFALSRTTTVGQITEKLKTSTAKWSKEKWGDVVTWQGGYGAFSVGTREVDHVAQYVRNQDAHHRETSFEDEFRALLKESGISFDERYMWD